jgi:TolB-like protein/tetratricopeptide (TPR) repeat protein/class 3 adenylate cyclase
MADLDPHLRLEIAHVLFIDIVGSSKLLTNEQSDLLRDLNRIVRSTDQVRTAEAAGKLIRLPTGDGMALAFFTTPDAPVRCAMEIGRALKEHGALPLRMGIHSGPVDEVVDVNERSNVAGAGITIAQRVMDCGDAGHILLSKRVADDLAQYSQWRPHLHDLGEVEVKHGTVVRIVNLHNGEVGNAALPEKLKQSRSNASAPPRRFLTIPIAIGLILLLAGAIFWFGWRRESQKSGQKDVGHVKRMAVLPFKPVNAGNGDEILEMGMADTLITKLSNSREMIVSSLNSVRKYNGLEQDSVAAGRALQVDSVLEGHVQKVGDRIRVTTRLINVGDGATLWGNTFDEKFTDVFAVQDAISQKVADALALRLSGEEKERLARRYTENVEAYQLYLTGRYHYTRLTPVEIRTGIGFFSKAIESDPTYALAYFGLAESYRSLAITSDVPSKDSLPQAKAAATKALQIDDSLAEAHASLSFSLIWYDWDWAGADKEAKRAVELNPNSAMAHFAHAHILSDLGRHDEALAESARARELEPLFLLPRALEGMFLHHARRDLEAVVSLQKTLEIDPNFWITHLTLGKVDAQLKRYPEALTELMKAKEFSHGNSEAIGSIGYVAGLQGDSARAHQVLEELRTLSAQHYIPPYNVAMVYAGLGSRDEALASLDKACDERDVRVTLLRVDPRWDSLRADPHFKQILRRVGL